MGQKPNCEEAGPSDDGDGTGSDDPTAYGAIQERVVEGVQGLAARTAIVPDVRGLDNNGRLEARNRCPGRPISGPDRGRAQSRARMGPRTLLLATTPVERRRQARRRSTCCCRVVVSRSIDEIMNRELLAVVPETPVQAIRELLRTFAISAVPVLSEERRPLGMVTADAVIDGGGTAADRMTRPAMCIEGSSGIEAAARRLALADAHHIVVVDSAGAAVGVVSVLDVLRAMLGMPAHPAAFPHWDAATQASWTDEWPLDESASQAPDAAGVLVLTRGLIGETDAVVWVEACANVRNRIAALTALGSSAEPALARLLERHDLRFRAAAVCNDADRERLASGMNSDLANRPPPGAT
jgi:CBS domain-containing protein